MQKWVAGEVLPSIRKTGSYSISQKFQVSQTLPEALRLAAALIEERDEAIRTKSEIGSRREATAMNTASQAIKQVNRLQAELDRSMQYCTIKRMEMLQHGQKFDWRLLKSTGIEMGIPPIDVFDANYGKVKSYHADVWKETYGHLEKPPKLAIKSQLIEPINPCQLEAGYFSLAWSGFFSPKAISIRPSGALCPLAGKSRGHSADFQGA